ncbi:ABC transporter permease [Ammoniphilus resinae]|uniref:Spermidine/putrescine transport system permease protein n=1 Tax=Ammoniphilus resinae TaxID=861532 RepID=A0ABS4GSB3_9BACL|nr:ABC transporter permease subunit [Ammoniphilus resinae]MBP1933158.1 putative spermidine/putrescine transport system permease protein [Ammoniphilus resinae]
MKLSIIKFLVVLGILFFLAPLVLTSLSAGWRWPMLWPAEISWRSWEYLFSGQSQTGIAVFNSLLIACGVTIVNLGLAIPAAYGLIRFPLKGKLIVQIILFAPLVIPPFVSLMGIHFTFIRLGLTESLPGLILAHLTPTLPYMIWALLSSYRTVGPEWEEQARMLGANGLQRMIHVVIPFLLPGILAGSSLSILVSLSQYLITFLIGGGQVITLPILLFPFISGGDPALGAAYALLFIGMAFLALFILDCLLKWSYRRVN